MKIVTSSVIALLLVVICTYGSQAQSTYYGIDRFGGLGKGSVFKYSDFNSLPEVIYNFETKPEDIGKNPQYYLHTDNSLYAYEISGKTPVLNRFNPATNKSEIVAQLNYRCQSLMGKTVKGPNGNLYGIITKDYGPFPTINGLIISYSFQTNQITIVAEFPNAVNEATSNLLLASNGNFYFTTSNGIACFDPDLPANQAVYLAYTRPSSSSWCGEGDLIETSNGLLIGTLNLFPQSHAFSFNYNTGTYTNLYSFTWENNACLHGFIKSDYDQKLYGVTNGYAFNNYIYSFNPATSQSTILHQFDSANVSGKLTQLGSKLYGVTQGGELTKGSIFCYDIASGLFETLYEIQPSDLSSRPIGSLTLHPNGKLYGMADQNTFYRGTFYSFDLNTNEFDELFFYDQSEKGFPTEFIQGPNNQLYGLTTNLLQNSTADTSYLFTVNTETDQLEFLSTLPGNSTYHTLATSTDNKVYTASIEYAWPISTFRIIQYDVNSQNTAVIYSSTDYPMMTNIITSKDNTKLFGQCLTNGGSAMGLCSFSLATNTITQIHPIGDIVFSNKLIKDSSGTIYTMTNPQGGGINKVFAIDPQSESVSVLHTFNSSETGLMRNFCMGNDGKLYGCFKDQSSSNVSIYSLDPVTTDYVRNIDMNYSFDFSIMDHFFMGNDNNFHGFTVSPSGSSFFKIDPQIETLTIRAALPPPFSLPNLGPIEIPNSNALSNSENNYSWNLYPNPTADQLFLNCNVRPTHIKVLNLLGNQVYEIQQPSGTFNTLYIDQLSSGVYYVQITFPSSVITCNFVKL
ncbi:hypothetical protein D3C71_412470 [compost metagenome]